MMPSRRAVLAGSLALAAAGALPARAQPQTPPRGMILAAEFGLVPHDDPATAPPDQSSDLQLAVDAAASAGLPLFLAGGIYGAANVELPSACTIVGVRGATRLAATAAAPVFRAQQKTAITLRDLALDGAGTRANADLPGLVHFLGCEAVELDDLTLIGASTNGVYLDRTSGRLENLVVQGCAANGIFALDSFSLAISRCRIFDCGNGGVRVWARETGAHDGTIIADNDIHDIRADGGGGGENGNGVSVFRTGGVSVSGNRIRNCAFSAIRLDASTNAVVSANTCLSSGDVAILAGQGSAGAVVADNMVDGAAQGIGVTGVEAGGRLATCSGNVVRNIYPESRANPETLPIGILAEADTAVTGNVVETVPGTGIAAGSDRVLRDVNVTGNVVRDTEIGIAVSVAEGAGAAVIADNRVSAARRAAIAGTDGADIVAPDLEAEADRYPRLTVTGNG